MKIDNPDTSHCGKHGGTINLQRAVDISPRFASDVAQAIETYRAAPDRWQVKPATVRTLLSRFLPALPDVAAALEPEHLSALARDGLAALSAEAVWADLEGKSLTLPGLKPQRGNLTARAFNFLHSIQKDEPGMLPPSILKLRFGTSDVGDLYRVSPSFLLYFKQLLLKMDATEELPSTTMAVKHHSYAILALLVRNEAAVAALKAHGLDAFEKESVLLDKVMQEVRTWQSPTALESVLELHDPVRWGRKWIVVHGHAADLTETYNLSTTLFGDMKRFGDLLSATPLKGRKPQSFKDKLTAVQRALLDCYPYLSDQDAATLKKQGVCAFIGNDLRLLRWLYGEIRVEARTFPSIKDFVEQLFPEIPRWTEISLPYRLTFDNEFSARPTYCDYGPIREISVKLYDDMAAFLEDQKQSIDQKSYNSTTVYHQFTQFKAAMVLAKESLSAEHLGLLEKHGMKAFDLPGHKLQKALWLFLQNTAKAGVLTTSTAYTYKSSVTWFLDKFGFHVVEAFPITQTKTAKHLKRLNTDDYYSAEQCREIAYHIECGLLDTETTDDFKAVLLLGRILLKTGWNLAPTLGIECDDIVRAPSALNPNGVVTVVLRKARAGYRSDGYTFSDPETNAVAMKSAVADLMMVRDALTASLRDSLPLDNPFRNYVFLVDREGLGIERLGAGAAKTLTYYLERRGSSLTFDTKKIRKGGVNHLYRQVQKDLQAYEAAAKHNFETFESHYYRIDENQSRYTLGKAVDVMGKYFTGKEIAKEIIIITEPSPDLQHTPVGECASSGNDSEVDRYNKDHRKLHAEKGAASRVCADFLSCVWCKFFRLVADPEHAWKLLSYREYLLSSMESSALEGDETDDQQFHIEILRNRVSEMLSRLDKILPGVAEQGEVLLRNRGMHPDWSFALADAPVQ